MQGASKVLLLPFVQSIFICLLALILFPKQLQSCQNAKKHTDLYYSLQVFTGRMCGGFVGLWGMTSVFLKILATALKATGPKSKWHHSNLPLIGGNWTYNSPLMQRLHNSITHSLQSVKCHFNLTLQRIFKCIGIILEAHVISCESVPAFPPGEAGVLQPRWESVWGGLDQRSGPLHRGDTNSDDTCRQTDSLPEHRHGWSSDYNKKKTTRE